MPPPMPTLDPVTGRQISSLTAAALCVKPRGQMTPRQIVNVDALKVGSVQFTTTRPVGEAVPRPASRWHRGEV
jgi:hypothetical protein